MENLSISDHPPPPPGYQHQQQQQQQHGGAPPPGGQGMPHGHHPHPHPHPSLGRPPQPQHHPAQMFTTAAQLLDLTDKKLMVALRDGRKLLGILRSWDQFANLVLQNTKERIFVPPNTAGPDQTKGLYADIERGIFLVRGENVLLLGEIDLDKDDDAPPGYELADRKLVEELAKQKKQQDKLKEKKKVRKLGVEGFEGENLGEMLL
ncbi:hypothetical protein QBC38DRAFT_476273 [Podospora fimiseda]|uniref:U6 snRNA-associated Sm-like protein LSm1 n=1 Tax=Podospora fimiseda TaxID=252190 RepID=A0AAN7BR18_9PEZI|nr:hypothetical protein QBC38DRAFT_476273 [Podospora fimiseda]